MIFIDYHFLGKIYFRIKLLILIANSFMLLKFIYLLYCALIFLVIYSCQENKKTKNTFFKMISMYYRDTVFTKLKVYPASNEMYEPNYYFYGKPFDSTTVRKLFGHIQFIDNFYGIFRFKVDNKNYGFLTRTPSLYQSSKIELWIYNLMQDTITNKVDVSEHYGDAGASETFKSMLFFDEKEKLNVLVYWKYEFDHKVGGEDENDTIYEKYRNFYLIKFHKGMFDTILKDTTEILRKYKKEIEELF